MNIYSIFTCLLVFISTALAVSLRDDGTSYILDNDYSTVVIAKKSGYITSLKLKGRNEEFLNRSYIDANGGKVYFSPSSSKVIKNTSSHVEVAFYDNYRSGSKLGLDWEVRYTMLSDTRGVYFSLTNTHKSNYPDTSYSEIRLVLRLKANIFDYLQVEDNVARVMPSAADQNKCVEMGPKEACKLPNGEVIHKYDYSVDMLKHNVHGFSSRSTGLGCWFVSPSMEWKNGGAYNRDLSCHQGGADSLQIMYMNGSHYGGGDAQLKQGENFQKVYGPFLIYLNRANSVQAAWSDAKNMASSEGRKWPYSFVSQPGYVKERGKVTGTLAINNPLTGTRLPLEDAVVTLVQQPSNTEPIPTQQWRHTSHWAHSLNGATPNFVIYAVVPGTYQLRAWSKNVVGEFVLDKLVTVKAGEVTNLGKFTFNENRIAPIAWEIGIPDRTAMEYLHGDHFNQWGLYHKFKDEFPKSVNYYVGKSNYKKDWNYCQVSIPGNDGKYTGVPWYIYFNLDKLPTGTSALRISIAASSFAALSVQLNDGPVSAEIKDLVDDACIRRDGIRGIYRELEFKYEPKAFKIGENKITLYHRKTGGYQTYYQFDGIMYDHIRLEAPFGETAAAVDPQPQPQQPQSSTIKSGEKYYLINRSSGKALSVQNDSTSNAANVCQWTQGQSSSQQWTITSVDGGYKLINVNSGKALDVNEKSTKDGGNVIIWTDNGGYNQLWTINDLGDGYFTLENYNSGKLLDVDNGSMSDGGNVLQWGSNGGLNQQWKIVSVGGTTQPKTTTQPAAQPTSASTGDCAAAILKQGYKCCPKGCTVEYTDGDGNWGVHNGEWCGCGAPSNTPATCKSTFTSQGYKCCSANNCLIYFTDESGNWGIENQEWCGIPDSCN